MPTVNDFNVIELQTKWQELHSTPEVFSYNLKVTESKTLEGKYRLYAELNADRTQLRRAPQLLRSLNDPFEEEKFNFKKIRPQECMMTIPYDDSLAVAMIINISPLTLYHTLICPNVEMGLGQKVTHDTLRFCVDFLLSKNLNQNFRIGYNSPGALASVNHLHLHLIYVEKELFIDRAKLFAHAQPDIYRLAGNMPIEAICFIVFEADNRQMREKKLLCMHRFIMWLCDHDIPHNLFMTLEREANEKKRSLKIFIFARQDFCVIKEANTFNIGFCELAGYVPVGTKLLYDNITEAHVLERIVRETGDVFRIIYNYFQSKTGELQPKLSID